MLRFHSFVNATSILIPVCIFAGFSFLNPSRAFADGNKLEEQFDAIDFVESELQKQEQKESDQQEKQDDSFELKASPATKAPDKAAKPSVEYSSVNQARPFSDIAVVQKTLLPKTGRWYYALGGVLIPNDVFYKTLGASARLGYFFNETWGAELQAGALTSIQGSDLSELQSTQPVNVNNLITLQNFYGAQVLWSPVYGKGAFTNRTINPFELYLGLGIDYVTTAATAGALGYKVEIGEIFAMSKKNSVRVDLGYLQYTSVNILGQSQAANSILLSVEFQHFLTDWKER